MLYELQVDKNLKWRIDGKDVGREAMKESAHRDCSRRDGRAEYRCVVVGGRHLDVDRRGARQLRTTAVRHLHRERVIGRVRGR